MEDVNGEQVSQEQQPGEELGADAMAVEEARKRIHATLDAGEDPLNPSVEHEGHEVLERLHQRPAAKASREYPEETPGDTDSPQGTGQQSYLLPGRTGGHTYNSTKDSRVPGKLGGTGCAAAESTDALHHKRVRPGNRPGKNALGKKSFIFCVCACSGILLLTGVLLLQTGTLQQPLHCSNLAAIYTPRA
eukprot:1358122-Amphidinium_carterae.1